MVDVGDVLLALFFFYSLLSSPRLVSFRLAPRRNSSMQRRYEMSECRRRSPESSCDRKMKLRQPYQRVQGEGGYIFTWRSVILYRTIYMYMYIYEDLPYGFVRRSLVTGVAKGREKGGAWRN